MSVDFFHKKGPTYSEWLGLTDAQDTGELLAYDHLSNHSLQKNYW